MNSVTNSLELSKLALNLHETTSQLKDSSLADRDSVPQGLNMYIVSSYSFVLIALGLILIKTLYELKPIKNEKKNAR